MRKNGVNREIRPVLGGICAADGFSAAAISCGFRADGEADLALLTPERRCPVAVASLSEEDGELVSFYKKRLKSGYAQAVFLCNGFSYAVQEDGMRFAENFCREVDLVTRYSGAETLFFAVGELGNKMQTDKLVWKRALKELPCVLGATEENGVSVARALKGESGISKQLSFSFYIRDVSCKVGAICRSGADGTLVLLTTDVRITQPMLQRAIEAGAREKLRTLILGYPKTPNDCVCILANGTAGNCLIDCVDSEYKKFDSALRLVLVEVCKTLALGKAESGILICTVSGAKSKQTARAVAKALAGAECLRLAGARKRLETDALVYTVLQEVKGLKLNEVQISVSANGKTLSVFEDGKKLAYGRELLAELFSARETTVEVSLFEGNYSATAYGRGVIV